jgi:caffeoyl-CoA O-methyltransferase
MSEKTIGLTDELHRYVVAHVSDPDPLMAELRAETRARYPSDAQMQIAPEQAPFLTMLAMCLKPKLAVEIGTFTGTSALAIARGLPPGGRLICCDVSAEYTSVARSYWARAGVADRIELRLGPGLETLRAMPAEPHIDMAFLDADKTGYPAYWTVLVPRIRSGGVILVDNTLRDGRVVAPPTSPDDAATIEFNDIVVGDDRVVSAIMPLADGVTMAVKK